MAPDEHHDPPGDRDGRGTRRTDPPVDQHRVATDLGILLSTEIDLAKLELREEAVRAARVGRILGAGAAAGWSAALLLSFAVAWAIGEALHALPVGFAIVGAVLGAVAAGLLLVGRRRMRVGSTVPRELTPPPATRRR